MIEGTISPSFFESGPAMLSVSFVLSILIQLVLPILVVVYLIRRYKTEWRLAGVGVLAYLVFQVAQPLLFQFIGETDFYITQIQPLPSVSLALVVGFLSAILEQAARTGGFWFVRKNIQEQAQGLTVAAGHAGVESVLIGLQFLINFIFAVSITASGIQAMNLSADDALKLQQQIDSFWQLPWYLPLAAGIQRIVGLVIQFGLGLMVWQAVNRKAWVWVGAAVLWQTAMSTLTVILAVNNPDLVSVGLFILMGVVNGGIFYVLYQKTKTLEIM
jgi:uncharacterized membrane protein YhfC